MGSFGWAGCRRYHGICMEVPRSSAGLEHGNLYELLPAFIVALAAIIIVSLLTKAPDNELVEEFESVQAKCKQ